MDRVLQRRDTAANWSTTNPILAEGEIGIITDGAKGYKIGDGVTRWNALEYPANPTSVVGELGDSEVAVINQNSITQWLAKTEIFYDEIIANSYVNVNNEVLADANFNLYIYDVSANTQYDADKYNLMRLFFATGGGYALFVDKNDNIVGEPFNNGNTKDYYKNVWMNVEIPQGASKFKLTQAKDVSTSPAGDRPQSLPQKVFVSVGNIGLSPSTIGENTYNRAKVYTDSVLKNGLDEKLDKNFLDVSPTDIFTNTYVNVSNEEKEDFNFNLYYYNIVNTSKVMLYVGTGGGRVLFVDDSNSIVGSVFQTSGPDTYVNKWVTLEVPSGAVRLKATQAIQSTTHPTSYPIRVLMANQNVIVSTSESKWKDKKVLFIGDSITDTGYYVTAFQSKTDCIAYNRGLSGTTLAVSSVANSMCERLDLPASDLLNNKSGGFPTSADLIFILGGINDWGRLKSQSFGDFNDPIDNTTFCGALKYLFRGLKLKYPNAKIVALNLLHCYSPDSFPAWNELNYQDQDETKQAIINVNSVGKSMYDYRDAITYCAKMYGIPVIDLFNVGFSSILETDRTNYYNDGLHPNSTGGNIMAEYILNQLNSI